MKVPSPPPHPDQHLLLLVVVVMMVVLGFELTASHLQGMSPTA
jgi:hypothetical protein